MLQNAYFLAKIGADTAENEQHFAENLPKIGNYPTGPPGQSEDGGMCTAEEHMELCRLLNRRRKATRGQSL